MGVIILNQTTGCPERICCKPHSKECDRILPDERVRGGKREAVRLRLADEHSIEGIAVQRRQAVHFPDSGFIQCQRRNEMLFALQRDELRGRLWQRQFAEAVFDGDFPERDRAQKNLVVRITDRGGETWRKVLRRRRRARGIRRYPAGFSSAFKRPQDVFRQWRVEVVRDDELPPGKTGGARL